jgi:NADPH:quinone reductase-like Zn-dependent oxidoreductase
MVVPDSGKTTHGQEEEYVRSLGAAHTVDYTGDIPAAVRAIAPRGVDKVLHAAGDAAALGAPLKAGGTIASTRGASAEEIGRQDVTVAPIMAAATADKLAALLDQVAAGTLRVNIETAIPLERARGVRRLRRRHPRQGPRHTLIPGARADAPSARAPVHTRPNAAGTQRGRAGGATSWAC